MKRMATVKFPAPGEHASGLWPSAKRFTADPVTRVASPDGDTTELDEDATAAGAIHETTSAAPVDVKTQNALGFASKPRLAGAAMPSG